MWSAPVAAETFAISGGTVALGDGSQPIRDGMVIVRDGRILAAGDIRMKLPAGTQVIDATGKWVTPGIVAGFSRLGLADVDLSAEGADDTTADGPIQRGCRRVHCDQSARHHGRRKPRRRRHSRDRRAASRQEHFRRAGHGDRYRGRHAADHGGPEVPVRRAWPDGSAEGRGLARFFTSVLSQRATRSRGAGSLFSAHSGRAT